MTIIFILIPLGLVLLIAAVSAFFWATRAGQFDDLDTPAWRILLDEDANIPETESMAANRQKLLDPHSSTSNRADAGKSTLQS